MMNAFKKFRLLAIGSLLLAGCTTAGPYVTNISSDGDGGLTIERCQVELNAFLGVISTGDCSMNNIRLATRSAFNPTR